jgi:hypothetical protein
MEIADRSGDPPRRPPYIPPQAGREEKVRALTRAEIRGAEVVSLGRKG